MISKKFLSIMQYCLVALIIILLVLLAFTLNELAGFKKFMPIANLYFNENEWIKVNYAQIYLYGDKIAPNEKLQLMINVTNIYDHSLKLDSVNSVSIGGVVIPSKENQVYSEIDPLVNKIISNDFYLADAGPNTIDVKLKISFVNGTFIKYENASTTINVMSQNEVMQMQQNFYTVVGIVSSSTLTGIALFFTIYQTIQLRNEKKQTMRAWLGKKGNTKIELLRVRNAQNQTRLKKEWDEMSETQKQIFKPTFFDLILIIKNFGQIPAFNVGVRFAISTKSEREELEPDYGNYAEIMPNDEKEYPIELPTTFLDEKNQNENFKFYVIFEARYNSGESDDEKLYGFISEFTHGALSQVKTWTEKYLPKKSKPDETN